MKNQYFPSLDGLRFIAAATVVLSHFETIKHSVGMPYVQHRFFVHGAAIAVTFFFVLSGFLIFWWLLRECKGNLALISLRKFYLYRISRTWPLYFLAFSLSLGLAFANNSLLRPDVAKRFISYFLLLPNTADVFYGMDIYLGPAWSLGVEECFYLFFPILIIKSARRWPVQLFLLGSALGWIVVSAVINPIALQFLSGGGGIHQGWNYLGIFFERYRFYSFFLGALAAWIVANKASFATIKQLANSRYGLMIVSLVLLSLIFNGITFSFLTHQVYSILFSIFLAMLTLNKKSMPILENPLLRLGGSISYGMYLLHMFLVMRLCNQLSFLIIQDGSLLSTLLSWILILGLTMFVAYLVHRYFEKPLMLWLRSHYLEKGEKYKTTERVPLFIGIFKKHVPDFKG